MAAIFNIPSSGVNLLEPVPDETLHGPLLRDQVETRKTSVTGGQKGSKLAKFSLIPAQFLWALAEHFGKGAQKYDPWNWLKGYEWSLCMDALERHYNAWKMGESYDEETGSHHLVAVAWHCCALFIFELQKLGTDDRGKV